MLKHQIEEHKRERRRTVASPSSSHRRRYSARYGLTDSSNLHVYFVGPAEFTRHDFEHRRTQAWVDWSPPLVDWSPPLVDWQMLWVDWRQPPFEHRRTQAWVDWSPPLVDWSPPLVDWQTLWVDWRQPPTMFFFRGGGGREQRVRAKGW